MNLPKGIVNIITDYAHTLFYLSELRNKTQGILHRTNRNIYYRRYSIIYKCYLSYEHVITYNKRGWWVIIAVNNHRMTCRSNATYNNAGHRISIKHERTRDVFDPEWKKKMIRI